MEKKKSPPPDRQTRTPKLKAPPGACDTHFHIFGPQKRFPMSPDAPLEFEDCTLDDLMRMHDKIGIGRGTIVQSFGHAHAYEYLLHALAREPQRFRGIARPAPDITDAELDILTKAGVVGARFAYQINPEIDMRLVGRIHERGWHCQFFCAGEAGLLAWRDKLKALPGNFVIDHMGSLPPSKAKGEGMRVMFEWLDTGRCWIKLSPRFSEVTTFPFADVVPMIQEFVRRAPERMLFGTDWPHPNYFNPMPNDADLIDLMLDWVPDEAVRRKIFTDNPAQLFGFPAIR
jgi:predicted TIM-barrel fold metal-dependent hydrolase